MNLKLTFPPNSTLILFFKFNNLNWEVQQSKNWVTLKA